VISWFMMGQVLEAAANVWFQSAQKKLKDKKSTFARVHVGSPPENEARRTAERKIIALEEDVKRKRVCLAIASDYNQNPMKLAKKCIMLLDRIRSKMGPVDLKRGTTDIRKRPPSENGLGTGVLCWMQQEVGRWATSLGVVNYLGQVVNLTAVDFADESEGCDESLFSVAAIMEQVDCRAVFAQIAQQSRVRAIFLKKKPVSVGGLVNTAAELCRSSEDDWVDQPEWWGGPEKHDFMLLDALLEYGYSGIQEALDSFVPELLTGDGHIIPVKLATSSLQYRTNQLTRELHKIVEGEEVMKTLRGSMKDSKMGTDVSKSQSASVQSNILSFFKSSRASNESLENTDDMAAVQGPDFRSSSKHIVVYDEPEGIPSEAQPKRKECSDMQLIDLTETSPEKKLKLTEEDIQT